jgi:hypothetical protein
VPSSFPQKEVRTKLGSVHSAVHPDRAEGIGAFNEDHEPTFADPDH